MPRSCSELQTKNSQLEADVAEGKLNSRADGKQNHYGQEE